MKLSRAVLCLIALLGLSNNVAGEMCVVTCGVQYRCDSQKMEECPPSEELAEQFRICIERCSEQVRAEQEAENRQKQKLPLREQLRREKLTAKVPKRNH